MLERSHKGYVLVLADKVPSIRNFLTSYYDEEAVQVCGDVLLLRF